MALNLRIASALFAGLWLSAAVSQATNEGVHEVAAVSPPELLEEVEAVYPAAAKSARREGRVVLQLTLDTTGKVTEATIQESAGHDFDEAAREAALRFRFSPARRGDTPIAVQILYAYTFQLPTPPPPPQAPPAPVEGFEVTVRGNSDAERMRRSAEAVKVIETRQARRQTADLGEVLARSEGVGVRRGGGLGSETRFSLNGLTDDQIRIFVDGVPLGLSGFPFGLANVPVNLVERVEIYRGVVPIRLGADALGGAVNLVTDDDVRGTHGSISYQAGSFGTHRLALGGRHLHEPSGFFARVGGFFDRAENDYPIDVEVPDDRGRLVPMQVHRFHDDYQTAGAQAEVGFVDRPWARRLLLRGFATSYASEVQHNIVMTVPYGDVELGEITTGATLRYEQLFANRLSVDAMAGYAYGRSHLLDVGECVYDWFGQCVRERSRAGESGDSPSDQLLWQHGTYGRMNIGWQIDPHQAVRVSLSPTFITRTGDERRQPELVARDPLTAESDLFTLVSGAEYEVDLFDDRLENVAFVKDYVQLVWAEEPLPSGTYLQRDRNTHRMGIGNALRYRLLDGLYAKASYEWATRLPRPVEIFGDGFRVIANLELAPETSHNANLGLRLDLPHRATGDWRIEVGGFLREAHQLIVPIGTDRALSYQNVFGARSTGVEGAAGWTSPGRHLTLDANATWLDFRNTASEGTFGDFAGDRIPNRPWFFANAAARFRLPQVAAANDELALVWNTRYVHEFFRGWQSIGRLDSKQVVPSQLMHSLALVYLVRGNPVGLSFTGEVQNLTNESAFDFYGVQRPGRSVSFKVTAEL